MRILESARSRRTIDNVMLLAVVACLLIAAVRLGVVMAVIPYAFYVDAREDAKAEAAGLPEPDPTVLDRIEHSPAGDWWARKAPFREGGDYFGVLSRHSTIRSLGCVIGVTAEQERDDGVAITRILVPEDEAALYGQEPGTPMVREDGTTFRTNWGSLGRYVAFFSDAEVVKSDYDPFLTASESAELEMRTDLEKRAKGFYVAEDVRQGSGTWVLLARQRGDQREFVFVPIEDAPVGELR